MVNWSYWLSDTSCFYLYRETFNLWYMALSVIILPFLLILQSINFFWSIFVEPQLADMSVSSYCFIPFLLSTSYSGIKWDRRTLSSYYETEILIMGDVANPQKNTFPITFIFYFSRGIKLHTVFQFHTIQCRWTLMTTWIAFWNCIL